MNTKPVIRINLVIERDVDPVLWQALTELERRHWSDRIRVLAKMGLMAERGSVVPAVLSDLSSNSNLSSSPSGLPLDGKDDHNPIPDLGDALDDFF
jgi:hypothetical protein